jgi:outer membrane protein TolC
MKKVIAEMDDTQARNLLSGAEAAMSQANDALERYKMLHDAGSLAEENLRLNRDYYKAGTSKMSDLLEAQLLYQQSLDRRTDAYADYQNKLLEYRQSTGQKVE